MLTKIIEILILLFVIILSYVFLFWVIKQFSENFCDYDNSSKQEKRAIFFSFIVFSGFIIAPSYFIFSCILKMFTL